MTNKTSSIKILRGLDTIRKRPGMFIGETNRAGLHHLIYEILNNSVDEAIAGYCNKINITFHPEDNSVEISDNGRGIPVDIHPEGGISLATLIYTVLHMNGDYGVGAVVTNALSAYLEIVIRKHGKVYYQHFENGVSIEPLKIIRDMNPNEENGTTVRFSPNVEIFPEALEEEGGINLSASYIKDRIKRTSYLVKKLRINLTDEFGEKTEYYFANGIKDLVNDQTQIISATIAKENNDEDRESISSKLFDENIYFNAKDGASSVEVCFNYVNKYSKNNILSFANHIHTEQGGTHVNGFLMAIKKVLTDYAIKHKNLKSVFTTEDVLEGINVVISFSTQEPKFCDAIKQKLSTISGKKLTYSAGIEFLENFLENNTTLANLWIDRVMCVKNMREKFEKE